MAQLIFLISIFIWIQIVFSQTKQISGDAFAGKTEMNGYQYKQFEGIEKNGRW